jgi:hypothetical protein
MNILWPPPQDPTTLIARSTPSTFLRPRLLLVVGQSDRSAGKHGVGTRSSDDYSTNENIFNRYYLPPIVRICVSRLDHPFRIHAYASLCLARALRFSM